MSQPRTDLSAILISLFRRFNFPAKSSQRSLASLVSSLFNVDERFSTVCKIFWLNSNCILFPSCLDLKVSPILAFLFHGFVTFSLLPLALVFSGEFSENSQKIFFKEHLSTAASERYEKQHYCWYFSYQVYDGFQISRYEHVYNIRWALPTFILILPWFANVGRIMAEIAVFE